MLKKMITILLSLLCFLTEAMEGKPLENIEVFDINQQTVVKIVPNDYEIQKLVQNYIQGIDGVYSKFNPIPEKGYAVKIPLAPAVKVDNKEIKVPIEQVILMCPENERPFLMLMQDENKLSCFTFKGSSLVLLESIGYEPSCKITDIV
ncbi:MAG: hypothetical protein GX895_05740 [Clostridiales bacterium]|uniref:hypothetical protein n=1 Tax=Clostridium sp. N3C TaxID=1776758 RepID=UPI00092DFDF7|nr:hypothetical protein [Clostridium sp. N3C]NLZ48284.1 hypothetical protein [Clostridiales bacterium]SCN22933.1 hypothetical protein N3C_1028 [Clostridium sp. N3C]